MDVANGGGAALQVLGYLGPVLVAFVAGRYADKAAKRAQAVESAKAEHTQDTDRFAEARALEAYIAERVKEAVADAVGELETRVANLEDAYGKLARKYRLVRDAFREFIRATRAKLGPDTPAIKDHVRELMIEDDLDGTFDEQQIREVREIRDQIRDTPPSPTT